MSVNKEEELVSQFPNEPTFSDDLESPGMRRVGATGIDYIPDQDDSVLVGIHSKAEAEVEGLQVKNPRNIPDSLIDPVLLVQPRNILNCLIDPVLLVKPRKENRLTCIDPSVLNEWPESGLDMETEFDSGICNEDPLDDSGIETDDEDVHNFDLLFEQTMQALGSDND